MRTLIVYRLKVRMSSKMLIKRSCIKLFKNVVYVTCLCIRTKVYKYTKSIYYLLIMCKFIRIAVDKLQQFCYDINKGTF